MIAHFAPDRWKNTLDEIRSQVEVPVENTGLNKAIKGDSYKNAEAIKKSDEGCLEPKDIIEKTGISENTVYTALKRMLKNKLSVTTTPVTQRREYGTSNRTTTISDRG